METIALADDFLVIFIDYMDGKLGYFRRVKSVKSGDGILLLEREDGEDDDGIPLVGIRSFKIRS